RAGTSHAAIAPYGAFTCVDGTQIMLAIQNEREWERFATQVLDRPDMVTDDRFDRAAHRFAHREELEKIIGVAFATLTGEQCDELLETARVAHSRQRDMSEIADHPQLTERGRWHHVDTPAGPISMLAPPVEMSGVGCRMDPIPAVGQNSEASPGGLGMEAEKSDELQHEGVIRGSCTRRRQPRTQVGQLRRGMTNSLISRTHRCCPSMARGRPCVGWTSGEWRRPSPRWPEPPVLS